MKLWNIEATDFHDSRIERLHLTSSLPTSFCPNKIYKLDEIVLSFNPNSIYMFKNFNNGFVESHKNLLDDYIFLGYKPVPVFMNGSKEVHFHYEIKSGNKIKK